MFNAVVHYITFLYYEQQKNLKNKYFVGQYDYVTRKSFHSFRASQSETIFSKVKIESLEFGKSALT